MRAFFERPDDPWRAASLHLPLAVVSGIALVVGRFLDPSRHPWIPCWFRELVGRPCPFCGTTRSFGAASRGEWAQSVMESPMGFAVFVAVAATFVVSLYALSTRQMLRVHATPKERTALLWAVIAVVLANWTYRWASGFR